MGLGRDETTLPQAYAPAAGCAAVVVAAFTAAAFLGPQDEAARALVVGAAAAVCVAATRNRRHGAGVAAFGMLVFVGFLAHRDGDLTGDPSAWRYAALIALLAVLGRLARRAVASGRSRGTGRRRHVTTGMNRIKAGSGTPSRAR